MGLLPSGRAWQTHEQNAGLQDTVLKRFWWAFAAELERLHQRLCALLPEFFCLTMDETRDLWEVEYGFPDPCDPYEDVCVKVAATGGARCEYFTDVAARYGWAIECVELSNTDVPTTGCAWVGCTSLCRRRAHELLIRVILDESPAWEGVYGSQPYSGCAYVGAVELCGPDASLVECLIERIKPAHVLATYELV